MVRAFLAACALAIALPAWALTVTTLADGGGPGTLRSVIASTPAGETVDFAVSGTITLTGGQIAIGKNLVIAGPGAKALTISGGSERIFVINGGASVAISGLTFANGVAADTGPAPSGFGGAIAVAGTLTLDATRFTGNRASQGGGALYVYNDGTSSGNVTIRSSTLDANAVVGADGAGGGAILARGHATASQPALLRLLNSTVSGNTANVATAMSGGGIMFSAAQVTLVASTVAFNRGGAGDAAVSGANLHQGSAAGTSLAIRNSIVGRGQGGGGVVSNAALEMFLPGAASVASEGYNIVEHRPAVAAWNASDLAVPPGLEALGDRGGPTPTHALDAASPARNHVPSASCVDLVGAPLAVDQRGLARGPGSCASGAFEPQPGLQLTPAPREYTLQVGVPFTQSFTVAGGTPPHALVQTGDAVPGLSINALTLAGTPTMPGRYDTLLRATDSGSETSATQAYTFHVVRAPVTMTLASSSAAVPAGTGVTLTATVTGPGAPSGTVAFRDGAASVAGCTAVALSGPGPARVATCATSGLSMGAHTFTALYGGGVAHVPATATAVVSVTAVPGTECAAFGDVDASNDFCANIDWLRNRGITNGCAPGSYCPDQLVTRLAMAAVLNRLGTALTPALVMLDEASGARDPDAMPVVCMSDPVPAVSFPRRATVDAVLTGTGSASGTFAASTVASLDDGASWQALSTLPAGLVAGHWINLRLLGSLDVAAGQGLRFGIRIERGDSASGAGLADSRCVLRASVGNRNETFSPFDEPE